MDPKVDHASSFFQFLFQSDFICQGHLPSDGKLPKGWIEEYLAHLSRVKLQIQFDELWAKGLFGPIAVSLLFPDLCEIWSGPKQITNEVTMFIAGDVVKFLTFTSINCAIHEACYLERKDKEPLLKDDTVDKICKMVLGKTGSAVESLSKGEGFPDGWEENFAQTVEKFMMDKRDSDFWPRRLFYPVLYCLNSLGVMVYRLDGREPCINRYQSVRETALRLFSFSGQECENTLRLYANRIVNRYNE